MTQSLKTQQPTHFFANVSLQFESKNEKKDILKVNRILPLSRSLKHTHNCIISFHFETINNFVKLIFVVKFKLDFFHVFIIIYVFGILYVMRFVTNSSYLFHSVDVRHIIVMPHIFSQFKTCN